LVDPQLTCTKTATETGAVKKEKQPPRKKPKKREESVRSSGLRLTPELLPSRESRPKASPLLSSSLVRERERLQKRRRKVKRRKGGVAAGERKTEGAPWRGRMGGSSPRTRSRCSANPLPSSSTFLGNFTFYRRNRLAPKKKNPTYSVAFSFKILFAIYIY
jgi:hypothetical protein